VKKFPHLEKTYIDSDDDDMEFDDAYEEEKEDIIASQIRRSTRMMGYNNNNPNESQFRFPSMRVDGMAQLKPNLIERAESIDYNDPLAS
jgi:hypothetical protein